jgi:MoxR-like ATPase
MEYFNEIDTLLNNLGTIIRGKPETLRLIVLTLLARGHILLEDIPGVGKTTLAKALAKSISGKFSRIQFTPDLLPTDIVGSPMYNPKEGTFNFRAGPVFANILLADEINRASPRTQSSLLEAMSEAQVTVEGVSYKLEAPFLVIATQNPIEFHGTYPLPEAQLDRFAVQLSLGYPDKDEEMNILYAQQKQHPLETLNQVMDGETLVKIQQKICEVEVDRSIASYLLTVIEASRKHPHIKLGISPRGSLILFAMIRAAAFMDKRNYCTPDDVKSLAPYVLSHRLVLETKAKYSGIKKQDIISEIISAVTVPR